MRLTAAMIPDAPTCTAADPLFAPHRQALIAKVLSLLDLYTPGTPLADFFRWASSEVNPQKEAWLDLCGINEYASLTINLLSGLAMPER